MLILAILVVSLGLAYKAMPFGLVPILSRVVMGAVAIAAGVGFVGPAVDAIDVDNDFLFGACFIAITVLAYGFMRTLTMYLLLEREIALPSLADRIGGGIAGLLGGLMLCGFGCMAVLSFPLPSFASAAEAQLRRSAELGVAGARLVGVVAGSGDRLDLWAIMPHLDPPAGAFVPPPEPPPAESDDPEAEDRGAPSSDDATPPSGGSAEAPPAGRRAS
jgi:hypothetical protein